MQRPFIITILLGLLLGPIALAQDTLQISAEELIAQIKTKNLQAQIAEQSFEAAKADYQQSNAVFLPQVAVSHTAMTTTNPLMAFGFKLNQERLTPEDFNPALLNDPARINTFATQIEVRQPLLNVDGLFERQAARSKMEAYQLQANRTKEYLELEVSKAYMQLQLAYQGIEVLNKAVATAEANLQLVQNYYDQGMLQKPDLLSVLVRVNEVRNQRIEAQSNVANASDYLAFLLNEEQGQVIYQPATALDRSLDEASIDPVVPENRTDIMAMEKTKEAYEKMYVSGKMSFLPRLNAFGNYQMYDTQIFNGSATGYLAGVQLSWNLFDGYQSIGKTAKRKLEYEKSVNEAEQYKSQSQLEVNQQYRKLVDAQNKVKNNALALEQSKEAYRIRKNRFEEGLEKTNDLLMAETQRYQKEMEWLQSIFEYNFTKLYLKFLTQ